MLSHTDVHILTGILTLASTPDSVEVELGSMIHDQSAEKRRDVDVVFTVKTRDGETEGFAGFEVKDEGKPLDVTRVEQLACKLNDMPSLVRRAIVSASGYTKPACKKASEHQVELWRLQPWTPSIGGFPDEHSMTQVDWHWRVGPKIKFNPKQQMTPEVQKEIMSKLPRKLASTVLSNAVSQIKKQYSNQFVPGKPRPVNLLCTLNPTYIIDARTGKFEINEALITGSLEKLETPLEVVLKTLVKVAENQPYAWCAIAELNEKQLFVLAIGQCNARLHVVSVSERNQEKIRQLRLR